MSIKITMASARVNAGLTQKQLAEVCEVSESTVINWENGKSHPHIKRLPLLEKAYGIPLDYVKIPY
jgi:transcriptional regulator with XRE-family HTH domain